MIKVEVKSSYANQNESLIANALEDSIKDELNGTICSSCKQDSKVEINIRANKLSSLTTMINACCPEFEKKIEKTLYNR